MGWHIESGFRYRYVARIMDYMDFQVRKHANVLDVPGAEIYTEERPPIVPMASTKLGHLHGGSLGILDDIANLDMPDYPMKEVPFGDEGEGAAPPTPAGPEFPSMYMTLDRVTAKLLAARPASANLAITLLSAENVLRALLKRRRPSFWPGEKRESLLKKFLL